MILDLKKQSKNLSKLHIITAANSFSVYAGIHKTSFPCNGADFFLNFNFSILV
jgi:hypothetical protein